jgi:hypothetical protein
MLSWLRYCKAFPEVAENFPTYFPYAHNSWDIEFLGGYMKLIELIMSDDPEALASPSQSCGDNDSSWPGLQMDFIPSAGKPIADYFGVPDEQTNPSQYALEHDALMLLLTPTP